MKLQFNYLLLLKFIILMLCFTRCDTDVPNVDSIPPTYAFNISGDGLNHTFTETDDPSTYQVNLKFGIPYNFVFTCHDEGGIINSEITIQTEDYLTLDLSSDLLSQEWTSTNSSFLSRQLDWFYESGDPVVDGTFLQGTFTIIQPFTNNIPSGESRDFYLRINDFGGKNHNFNQTFNSIPLYIASDNQASEVIVY